jgi:hypothetical protein
LKAQEKRLVFRECVERGGVEVVVVTATGEMNTRVLLVPLEMLQQAHALISAALRLQDSRSANTRPGLFIEVLNRIFLLIVESAH